MKLTYPISFEDFCAVQPPFTLRAANNAGFKVVLVFCALLGALGVFELTQRNEVQVGIFLAGLSLTGVGTAYFFDKHSIRRAKNKYEQNLALGYRRIHCRDQRTFAADESGFTVACKCGTMTRPWSELTEVLEKDKFFLLGTKQAVNIIPKSAFPTEGARTEFRALLSEKLNAGAASSARYLELIYSGRDYRRGRWLHIVEGGGWRSVLRNVATLGCVTWGFIVLWKGLASADPAIRSGLIAVPGFLLISLFAKMQRVRKSRYSGKVKVHFNQEGYHLVQEPGLQVHRKWTDFIGYLEDDQVVLLYDSPRRFRILPKRGLGRTGADDMSFLRAKLPQYDYRRPIRARDAASSSVVRKTS